MADDLVTGGNGTDGKLTLLGADGQPVLTASTTTRFNDFKQTEMKLGAAGRPGLVRVHDREGRQSVVVDGSSGSVHLGSASGGGQLSLGDSVIVSAVGNRSEVTLGAPERPGYVRLTTGGNPGPTIALNGERNALEFLVKGSPKDSVLELNGNAAGVRAGGHGLNGRLTVNAADGTTRGSLTASDATLRLGGNGANGTVSVVGADGQPLLELLGRADECVLGLGQANRPGRISLYSGNRREALRLDGSSGDIVLANADCAEEFDLADPGVEPGTVMVLTDDGPLAPSAKPYDTRVAGVVSGAGSFRPGLVLDRRDTGMERAPIALMGKVYCKADADAAPIGIGDLLTTGERAGHAMRITDTTRALGAVLGKALAPLAGGCGLIPVLVALQ